MSEKCDIQNIVNEANISSKEDNLNRKDYLGISSLNWKFRYYYHRQSFNNTLLKNQTTLSKYYCKIKHPELTPMINSKCLEKNPL